MRFPRDRAGLIYTLAAEADPRLSEIRGLKTRNVVFGVCVVRFEDGFTTRGGHADNKHRRIRSVPLSDTVRAVLWSYCKWRQTDALVFEHAAKPGQPICGTSLYRRFRSAVKRAGLPIPRFQHPRGPADDGPPSHHHH
jgi:integrase